MSLTTEKFNEAWLASASTADAVPVSCALHKLAGKEGDAVDVCLTIKAADQQDFQRSRCACIFLIDNRYIHMPLRHLSTRNFCPV